MSIRIALAGNPNCGKTTMYNALTGANGYVGNWPGVTVEKKEGMLKKKYKGSYSDDVIITDLPGIYSLSPYTLEEVVSRDFLVQERPDVIVNLIDATNIERNLYLSTQLMELGIPVIIGLNMYDILEKSGDTIDIAAISKEIGCEIIPTTASKEKGLDVLMNAAIDKAGKDTAKPNCERFSDDIEALIKEVSELIKGSCDEGLLRWYSIKLIERDSKINEKMNLSSDVMSRIDTLVSEIEKKFDDDSESIITNERYNYITKIINSNMKKKPMKMSTSDKIDRIVTNRILGLPIFLIIMYLVYQIAATWVGQPLSDWVNDTVIAEWIQGNGDPAEGPLTGLNYIFTTYNINPILTDLVINGIVAGVGAVIGFLPLMVVLFLEISILEDVGYMARVAFVMDRLFRHFGLSGKSIISILISTGCGVPGISSSKTIENDNDRKITIFTTTSIPCGAKLPVIALIGGVVFGEDKAGLLAFIMYVAGIAAIVISSVILKKFKSFHGVAAPFVMELPSYHLPNAKVVLIHVWERAKGFVYKAGTIILLSSIVMWFLSSFGFVDGSFGLVDENSSDSLLEAIGGFLVPIFAPIGLGNPSTIAASISGFVAKENILTTMGVLKGIDIADADDAINHIAEFRNAFFGGTAVTSSVIALSFLVFNLLNSPCFAAISTMAKELNNKKMFWFAILWQNGLAYVYALITYQIGMLIVTKEFSIGTAVAIVFIIALLYLLFRRDPYKKDSTVVRSVKE